MGKTDIVSAQFPQSASLEQSQAILVTACLLIRQRSPTFGHHWPVFWKTIFLWTGWGMVLGWFKSITFIVHFITSASPQIMRHWIPEVGDPCYKALWIVKVTQWCPTLCDPMEFSSQNTGVGSCSFSRGSSQPRGEPSSFALQADSLPAESPGEGENAC